MQLTTVSSVARPAPAVDQRQLGWLMLALAALFALLPTAGFAADAPPPKLDSGDTAWILTSTALALMMTIPGLALFYGGLVRQQNVLATMMQSFPIPISEEHTSELQSLMRISYAAFC